MKVSVFGLVLAAVVLSGCATRPEAITAQHVSHEKYTALDCTQLATKLGDARAELHKFSEAQDSKANWDAAGVFLLALPVSQLSGDHEADVAKWKGEVEAIETAQIKNSCKSAV